MTASLWNPAYRLALASKSATRRELLANAGLPFEIVDAPVDEREVEAEMLAGGLSKRDLARALAAAKAIVASQQLAGAYCLGADQILIADGEILHKSPDLDDLRMKIAALAGGAHQLISAFAIARDGTLLHAEDDVAKLTMRKLSPEAIDLYVEAAGEAVLSSVGGYQLEKLGVHLFEHIAGDHTTILGLPMLKLLAWLRKRGLLSI